MQGIATPFSTMPLTQFRASEYFAYVPVLIEDVSIRVSGSGNPYQLIRATTDWTNVEDDEQEQLVIREMAFQGKFLLADSHEGAELFLACTRAVDTKALFLLDVANTLCPSYLEARWGHETALNVWERAMFLAGKTPGAKKQKEQKAPPVCGRPKKDGGPCQVQGRGPCHIHSRTPEEREAHAVRARELLRSHLDRAQELEKHETLSQTMNRRSQESLDYRQRLEDWIAGGAVGPRPYRYDFPEI